MKKKGLMLSLVYIIVTCLISLSLSGCGEKSDIFTEYDINVPISDDTSGYSGMYNQNYISDDICVVPFASQTEDDANISADAALLINVNENEHVFSKNIYKKLYPASTTKIVTTLVALKHGNLDDIVTVSYNASHITESGATLCGFNEGDKIRLKSLLTAFMVHSGNDAGIAIAEHIAGSVKAFAKLMNKEVAALGAAGSHFVNPHGLHDDKHYTTAYDLYLVFNELLNYDTFIDIIKHGSFKLKYKDASGVKKTVDYESTVKYKINTETPPDGVEVIGGKTGTTFMAGSNLILYSKNSSEKEYISVVMHASDAYSLYDQMNYLLTKEEQ